MGAVFQAPAPRIEIGLEKRLNRFLELALPDKHSSLRLNVLDDPADVVGQNDHRNVAKDAFRDRAIASFLEAEKDGNSGPTGEVHHLRIRNVLDYRQLFL